MLDTTECRITDDTFATLTIAVPAMHDSLIVEAEHMGQGLPPHIDFACWAGSEDPADDFLASCHSEVLSLIQDAFDQMIAAPAN